MKTLFLMRHAKAGPSQAGMADFDRPLVPEGVAASERIGEFIKSEGLVIDAVFSSAAVRARQTVEAVLQAAGLALNIKYDERIYQAGPLQLLEVLSELERDVTSMLVVGHNPTMEELIKLCTQESVHLSAGTLGQIEFEIEQWDEVPGANGALVRTIQPKDLV